MIKELKVELEKKHTLEKNFTTEWLNKLDKQWFSYDKISDWSIWTKKVDCYIFWKKVTYICEVKMITNDIFKISQLSDNQYAFLKRNIDSQAIPIVCIYSKKLNKYKIILFEKIVNFPRNDRLKLTFE